MNILDNELVRKYFGCDKDHPDMDSCVSKNVLKAMQEPIRKGERYLQQTWSGHNSMTIGFEERVYHGVSGYGHFEEDHFHTGYHSRALRLPDRFQRPEKKECDCGRTYWQMHGKYCSQPTPSDAVEEKIKEMTAWMNAKQLDTDFWEARLRELVRLAREVK